MKKTVFLLLLAGCSTPGAWDKRGATDQEFNQDRGFCIAQAYAVANPNQQAAIMSGCMQGKGWTWVEK